MRQVCVADAPSMMPPAGGAVKSGAQDSYTYITDVSSDRRDTRWDSHKAASESVAGAYKRLAVSRYDCCNNPVSETQLDAAIFKQAVKMSECGSWLAFVRGGEGGLKLSRASFCKGKMCTMCQWRRSLRWKKKMWDAVPELIAQYPDARFLFLTLTVRNCDITELKPTLSLMNRGLTRLLKREELGGVLGFLRTTEVTRAKDGSAHPHFHLLLMVSPSMLSGRGYVTQKRWQELWQECCKLDYPPVVDIRTVKERTARKNGGDDELPEGVSAGLARAVKEVTKYTTKEGMKVGKAPAFDWWYFELAKQLYRARLISTGGVIKEALQVTDADETGKESNEDLIMRKKEKDDSGGGVEIHFGWNPRIKRYTLSHREAVTGGFI